MQSVSPKDRVNDNQGDPANRGNGLYLAFIGVDSPCNPKRMYYSLVPQLNQTTLGGWLEIYVI